MSIVKWLSILSLGFVHLSCCCESEQEIHVETKAPIDWFFVSTEPVDPLYNSYRLQIVPPTRGMFPSSIAITRVESEVVDESVNLMKPLIFTNPRNEFVHWNNPVPVVAAIVEYNDEVVLANNVAWPENMYALITGFLEKNESPEEAVVREVEEELALSSEVKAFIGTYTFYRMNQLILAYHVEATGDIVLNHELRAYKCVKKDDLTYWDAGTGHALRDWLQAQGYHPQLKSIR